MPQLQRSQLGNKGPIKNLRADDFLLLEIFSPTRVCFKGVGLCLYALYESVDVRLQCIPFLHCIIQHHIVKDKPDPDHDNSKQMSRCHPAAQTNTTAST